MGHQAVTLLDAAIDRAGVMFPPNSDPRHVRDAIERNLQEQVAFLPGVPPHLHQAVRHALLGQSKRIRPLMLYLVAEPGEDLHDAALEVGSAMEMVHTASLILDDLPCMDDASMRRQRPTTHVAFGQSTAILAAIALLSRAFGLIAQCEAIPSERRNRLSAALSNAVGWSGLVAGQEIDINDRHTLTGADEIEQLNWLKTGVLFVAAAEMGAILRGLDERRIESVRQFARHFGAAFQTADDLIDQSLSSEAAGKDTGKDGDKATLVSLFGANLARLSCEEHLKQADAALEASGVEPTALRALVKSLFDAKKAHVP